MKYIIDYKRDLSLAKFKFFPGDLVAFDNSDPELPSPLILCHLKSLSPIHNNSETGYKLIYVSESDPEERSEWTAEFEGNAIGLWGPTNFVRYVKPCFHQVNVGKD
jgi:hypothetical protein